MCLNLSLFARRKTAKQNIAVCKVLCVPLYDPTRSFTPYQKYPVTFNVLDTSRLIRESWDVKEGMHTYADIADARRIAFNFFHKRYNVACYNGDMDVKVYKAIIPAGANYYYGKHGTMGKSYASDQLIVTDEILFQIRETNVPFN